jgi:hypothetical protein
MIGRTGPLRMRVLLLDPDCDSAVQRAGEIGESPAAFTAGIKLTLARLKELAAWEGHESTIYEVPQTPLGALWAGYRRTYEDLHANSHRAI